jgi:pyrroloquinoline quinone (PQQ) biosynthesis protein C
MNKHMLGAAFIKRISAEALESAAVHHPYLRAMSEGDLPNMDMAIRDFAFQYGLYSARFTRYVSAVIKNLGNAEHKRILLTNLDEEKGVFNDVELPPEVMASVTGQPHAHLFRRFQEALGVDTEYRASAAQCQTSLLWSRQFLQLCTRKIQQAVYQQTK